MNVGSVLIREMMSAIAAVAALIVEHLSCWQAIVGISAHFFATIRHVLIAAATLVGLAAAAQRQLWCMSGEKFPPCNSLRRLTAVAAAVDGNGLKRAWCLLPLGRPRSVVQSTALPRALGSLRILFADE